MSDTAVETTEAPKDNFTTNVSNLLHEIVDQLPLRHEWENSRLHFAIDNITEDPTKILEKATPVSPTDGNAGLAAEVAALRAEIASMVAAQSAATAPAETATENPAPSGNLSGA